MILKVKKRKKKVKEITKGGCRKLYKEEKS